MGGRCVYVVELEMTRWMGYEHVGGIELHLQRENGNENWACVFFFRAIGSGQQHTFLLLDWPKIPTTMLNISRFDLSNLKVKLFPDP